MSEEKASFPLKWILYGAVGIFVAYSYFTGGDSGDDYIEETLEDPTQGIIVELKEVEDDMFKITDEEVISNREDSRIIVSFLDNTIDTFTIDEVRLSEASHPGRSAIRAAAYGGLIGYMMGRPMSSGTVRSAYAQESSYNKSNQGRSTLRSTARKTTTRKPVSRNYGSGKSSRSYGG